MGSTSTSFCHVTPKLVSMARDRGRLPQVIAPTPSLRPFRSARVFTGLDCSATNSKVWLRSQFMTKRTGRGSFLAAAMMARSGLA